MLYQETVEAGLLDLIKRLMIDEGLKDFRLVGGTALSLRIGHRISVDIDLFHNRDFNAPKLKEHLLAAYKTDLLRAISNGVFGFVENIKLDVIAHQYPWLKPAREEAGIRFASLEDIAAMKVHAIVQNGSRLKDFVDMYFLLQHFSMKQMITAYEQKYPEGNRTLAEKAVTYFNDIDFSIPIKLAKGELDWEKMSHRLMDASIRQDKIFDSEKAIKKKKGKGL